MATKKHTYVKSQTDGENVTRPMKEAKEVGNAGGKRAVAIVLWILALACEVVALLILLGKIVLNFCPTLYQAIGLLVIDFILVVVGSQFWKKANHIDPVSKKDKVKFFLWNNMGVIVCCIAFVPFIVIVLLNKDLDKKTKAITSVAAVICLLIGGVASYDFNPVSLEEKQAAVEVFDGETVYWTQFGKVYHVYDDCGHLNRTDALTYGTVEQAIAENRTRLCSTCAKKYSEGKDITGVTTE